LPWNPVPRIPRLTYPLLGKFGLLYGLIEWGFLTLIHMYARRSVPYMPIIWRRRMVELMNARAKADDYKQELKRREEEAEAHRKGLIYGK